MPVMNAVREQLRGRTRTWMAALFISSVSSMTVYALGSPWYLMFTPVETAINFITFWLLLFLFIGLTKRGKALLFVAVMALFVVRAGFSGLRRVALHQRPASALSRRSADEVKVPKVELGLDLSQKAEAKFYRTKQPIFVTASFYALIPSNEGNPELPPKKIRLASEREIADRSVVTFEAPDISPEALNQLPDKDYYVSFQVSSARTFFSKNVLYCTSPIYRIHQLREGTVRVRCSLIDEPQVKLEMSKEPPLPEIIAEIDDADQIDVTQRAIYDRLTLLEHLNCDKEIERLDFPITVGQSMGGRVRKIRVVHYVPTLNRIPLRTESRLSDVREELHKVWTSRLDGWTCGIMWAEMTRWNLEAILEFDDGGTAALITDGRHVAVESHEGKARFLRLLR